MLNNGDSPGLAEGLAMDVKAITKEGNNHAIDTVC
jgi:plasmid replication initiation protein